MAVIQMSGRELTRLRVLIDLSDDRLTVEAAGRLLGLGRRQVYRLRRAFAVDGPTALVSLANVVVRAIIGTERPSGELF